MTWGNRGREVARRRLVAYVAPFDRCTKRRSLVASGFRSHTRTRFPCRDRCRLLPAAAAVRRLRGRVRIPFLPACDRHPAPRSYRLPAVQRARRSLVATVAELCFAAQWALILHRAALLGRSPFVQEVSLAVVPLIMLAEGCSWYAVLTTEQRAHAVENSLWGLSAALAVAGMLVIGPHRLAALYLPMIAGGAAYVAFIFIYDVPMYWSRWRVDQANGRRYLSVAEGMVDVCRRRTVSYRWEDWRNEVPWMSLYFTFGVWSSIGLVYASLDNMA